MGLQGPCDNDRVFSPFYLQARKDIVETPPKKEEKDEEEAEEDDSKEDENLAVKGSLTYLYGLVNPYLYRQLDLHTKDQKINQIILLQVCKVHQAVQTPAHSPSIPWCFTLLLFGKSPWYDPGQEQAGLRETRPIGGSIVIV